MPNRLFALLALAVLAPLVDGQRSAAEDKRLETLAQHWREYVDARETSQDVARARQALEKELGELAAQSGVSPLELDESLGRAVWLARDGVRVKTGKVAEETTRTNSFPEDGLSYAYRTPKRYEPKSNALPLILAIPDADERPADHIRTHWTSREVRDGAILVCPSMPNEREEWDKLAVNGRPGGLVNVLTALEIACDRFAIDFDRIYLVGRGKGVPAAITAGNYSPQRFAAVAGAAGDPGTLGPDNYKNLPTLFAGGGARAREFREQALEAGIDNCEVQPSAGEEELWDWLASKRRVAAPEELQVVVNTPFPSTAYWMRVAPNDPKAIAKASFDRESNTIRMTTFGIVQATLYLNDRMIDLSQPVRVICNEIETEARVTRSLPSTLNLLLDGTSDPQNVYVAELDVDIIVQTGGEAQNRSAIEDLLAKLDQAGDDIAQLRSISQWCAANGSETQSRRILERILHLAPSDVPAREALGHVRAHDRWFPSSESLARYEQRQDPEIAQARGYVEYKGEWVHRDDRSRVGKSQVQDPETGAWLTRGDQKRQKEGWQLVDGQWFEPADANRIASGLYFIDGEWVELSVADRRHSKIDSMWHLDGPLFKVHATTEREVAYRAMSHMERALPALRRVFGAEPPLPLDVTVLRDEEQYDRFAFGDPGGRRAPTHAGRLQTIHSACFAESWFIRKRNKFEFNGMGICYWDALIPHGNLYGVHSARLAAGLSFVDALDPSPKAVKSARSSGPSTEYYAAYEEEKQIPAWMRFGGAVYAERFFHDDTVGADGNPWWAREWSIDNLSSHGGLRALEDVLKFDLDADDRKDGQRLLIEAGLVVAFIVDGGCQAVSEKHEEFKAALARGQLHANHIAGLTEALIANESELRKFAGV